MKPSKSINSLANGDPFYSQPNGPRPQPPEPVRKQANQIQNGNAAPTSPICRCRVMYLGSSVPHITKDGLQGIQEPLKELFPDQVTLASGNAGIDSWLSVWSNGILIENVDETGREIKRFFKIEALHYCAAVKYVPQANEHNQASPSRNTSSNSISPSLPKFLPLDSPHARLQQANSSPPIFASILRRTTGVKVLECHAFICKREAAANALVRCCFHAYADTMYAKQIGADIDKLASGNQENRARPSNQAQTLHRATNQSDVTQTDGLVNNRRSKSIAALNFEMTGDFSDSTDSKNIDPNQNKPNHHSNSIMRRKSLNENNGDISENSHQTTTKYNNNANLRKHYNLSKSMHQLNQADHANYGSNDYASQMGSHSNSIHNLATSKARWNQAIDSQLANGQPAFYNPYASRVPSYPPQSLIDQQQEQHQRQLNNGGTLRSIKSVAANSIASTLLRSKKHAKAMSAAQMLNQQQQQQQHLFPPPPPILGFHQPHLAGSATLAPSQSFMMPPIPPMFLPRLPIINGSQTMKLPRNHLQMAQPHSLEFEGITPKEMKKLLKKSAKYGLDPNKFAPVPPGPEVGLPPLLPFRPMGSMPPSLQSNKSGTMNSQSIYSIDQQQQHPGQDNIDLASANLPYQAGQSCHDPMDPNGNYAPLTPIKSILVKPNPEFLKSKAGKKWLKQQKEFKKLLPPHLDGLPIVFGPPPVDALEVASGEPTSSNGHLLPPATFLPPTPNQSLSSMPPMHHAGLPVMDSNGFYSQPPPIPGQSMYMLPSGRASTASTLLRYSPHSIQQQQQQHCDLTHRMNCIDLNDSPYQQHQRTQYGQHPGPPIPVNGVMISRDHFVGPQNGENQIYAGQLGGPFDNNPNGHYLFSDGSNLANYRHRRRRHMIEQSVISLGDENEGEEEEEEERNDDEPSARARGSNGNHHSSHDGDDDQEGQTNGYYNSVNEPNQSQHYHDIDQQNYEQVMPPQQLQNASNDDQSSYSSGIYRRGHINERAFSYSIRQEHKSGSNSCNENLNNQQSRYSNAYHQHQSSVYDNPQQQVIFMDRNGEPHYDSNNNNANNRQADVPNGQLDQMSLRSFVNSSTSRVRSHM